MQPFESGYGDLICQKDPDEKSRAEIHAAFLDSNGPVPVSPLLLLAFFLLVIARRHVDGVTILLFAEIPDPFAKGSADLGEFSGAENHQNENENDDELCRTESEHELPPVPPWRNGSIEDQFLKEEPQSGSQDGIDGAGIDTGAAISAGGGIDDTDIALFADGIDGARGLARAAVNAFFSNGMGHGLLQCSRYCFTNLGHLIPSHLRLSTLKILIAHKNLAFPYLVI
jgi:hypothetical protein